MKKKKVLKIAGLAGAAIVFCGGVFLIGKKTGEKSLIKLLISLYEDGQNNMTITYKNGLIYELVAVCVGD